MDCSPGQKCDFCGATRIGAMRPLSSAYQHMRSPDNGWSPRRILLTRLRPSRSAARPFAPPSAVHSAAPLTPYSHQRRLSGDRRHQPTSLLPWFPLSLYSRAKALSIGFARFFAFCIQQLYQILRCQHLRLHSKLLHVRRMKFSCNFCVKTLVHIPDSC